MPVEPLFSLSDKVALVSGASRNIGLAIAEAFADAGATVVMTARGAEALADAAAGVRERTGAQVEVFPSDVSTADGVSDLVRFVHGRFDQVDILVNNAYSAGAGSIGKGILEIDDEVWEETFAANVLGPYRLCRGVGLRMMAGRGGSIINLLSGSGFLPNPGLAPYGATKAALWMMTRYLATELAPRVRVNALVPGMIQADSLDKLPQDSYDTLVASIPMGRTGRPSEVAPAAVYLASDAASYTTGTVLFANGGRPW